MRRISRVKFQNSGHCFLFGQESGRSGCWCIDTFFIEIKDALLAERPFCYPVGVIYLFHGSDTERVRSKAFAWVAKAREKGPSVVYLRLAREEITAASLEEVASSGGLFAKRLLVLLDDPYPAKRAAQSEEDEDSSAPQGTSPVDAYLNELSESNNAIVLLAPKLSAPQIKKLVAKATIEYRTDATTVSVPVRGFNTALVNALAARSRSALWLEVVRALRVGDAPEMLHGLLHWKARDLLEKGSRVWSQDEARELSLRLILLLRDSRRGKGTLGELLERFSLGV